LVAKAVLGAAIGTFPGYGVAGHAPDIFMHAFLADAETAAALPAERDLVATTGTDADPLDTASFGALILRGG